jgi:hypothetical protein
VSAGPDQGPERGRADQPARLGPLPRPLALALLAVWVLLTAIAAISLITGPAPWSGELEGLVPDAHRTPGGRTLVLLRVDAEALAAKQAPELALDDTSELDPRTIFAEAGFVIEEVFPDERIPLAPPKTEITRWLDAHALYLLPIDTHAALAERLTDAAMLAQVQSLGARLSSPLYSVSGDQPRRDPLGIHELTESEAGRLGHIAELPGADAPQVGANGDLISARGDLALIGLSTTRAPEQLQVELEAALEHLPVEIELIDPRLQTASVASRLADSWWAPLGGCFAGLIVLLAVTMRQATPVLVMIACLASGWVVLAWLGGALGLAGLDLLSLALSIMLLGFACDAGLRLPDIGARGWASTLILAGALVPLALSPYPLWQRWALVWPLAFVLVALCLRVLFPILLELAFSALRPRPEPGALPAKLGAFEWRSWSIRATPRPVVALLVCVGLCAAAIAMAPRLHYRAPARIPLVEDEQRSRERELTEHFFDPSMVVTVSTPADAERSRELGSPEAAALEAAAQSIAALAELVPGEARRIDTPASFVLTRYELEARKEALAKLKLGERMEMLQLLIADRGLRAEAFSEFVHGTADIDDLPSAAAALDGPLGPWIRGYAVATDDEVDGGAIELRGRVELRGQDGLPLASLSDARLAELPPLRGPAIAAMVDRRELAGRGGLVAVAGLWLTALLVWLGTGELVSAIACALVAASCEAGLVVALALLGQPSGPQLLPVVILVGAAAGLAGARVCREPQPGSMQALLVASGCQIVAGVVLLSSSEPSWRELGLALAIGSALACALGHFITPGLAALLRRRPVSTRPEGQA